MKEHCSHCYATPQHHLMLSGLNQLTSANKNPGLPQVLLMGSYVCHKEDPCLGEESAPSSKLAFLPLFCSPPGLCPCPGAMEPTASDLRLVPGAARTSWLQMPCAAGQPSPLSWPPASSSSPWESLWVSGHGLAWSPHTRRLRRKDAWESLRGVPEQRVGVHTATEATQSKAGGPGPGCCCT